MINRRWYLLITPNLQSIEPTTSTFEGVNVLLSIPIHPSLSWSCMPACHTDRSGIINDCPNHHKWKLGDFENGAELIADDIQHPEQKMANDRTAMTFWGQGLTTLTLLKRNVGVSMYLFALSFSAVWYTFYFPPRGKNCWMVSWN